MQKVTSGATLVQRF